MTVPYASHDAMDDEGKCYDNDNDDDKHIKIRRIIRERTNRRKNCSQS